jgi:hypothetical protein
VVKALAALIVVAGMLAAAAQAGADRAPTTTERDAIARAAGIRAGCAAVRVSTVRHRYKWALVRTRGRCLEPRTRSLPQIYRHKRERGAQWRLRWTLGRGCDALYSRVPQRVADDLGVACFE